MHIQFIADDARRGGVGETLLVIIPWLLIPLKICTTKKKLINVRERQCDIPQWKLNYFLISSPFHSFGFLGSESGDGQDGMGVTISPSRRRQRMLEGPQSIGQVDKEVRSWDWAGRLAREFISCRAHSNTSDGHVAGVIGRRCYFTW